MTRYRWADTKAGNGKMLYAGNVSIWVKTDGDYNANIFWKDDDYEKTAPMPALNLKNAIAGTLWHSESADEAMERIEVGIENLYNTESAEVEYSRDWLFGKRCQICLAAWHKDEYYSCYECRTGISGPPEQPQGYTGWDDSSVVTDDDDDDDDDDSPF